MRYKLGKTALFARMEQLQQSPEQRLKYLRHTLSVLMDERDFALFDIVAKSYFIFYMMMNEAFELIRLNYKDYLIIVQQTEHQYIIEIRQKEWQLHGN